MSPQDYIEWLDNEIEASVRCEMLAQKIEDSKAVEHWRGWAEALKAAKERFESIQF